MESSAFAMVLIIFMRLGWLHFKSRLKKTDCIFFKPRFAAKFYAN